MLPSVRQGSRSCFSHRIRSSPACLRRYTQGPITSKEQDLKSLVKTSKVEKIIRDTIKATGPMSFSTYMQMCLSHPTDGYYMNPSNPIFGTSGDFITSPEISQIFGELVAVWLLSQWQAAGCPPRIRVVELGPGRGTLMGDALRTWFQFPDCLSAMESVHLIETSTHLRDIQRSSIKDKIRHQNPDKFLRWHDSLDELADAPMDEKLFTLVIAHEFFDALPVHIMERGNDGWHDILVTTADRSETLQPIGTPTIPLPFRFIRSPSPTVSANLLAASSPRFASRPVGSRLEVSPTSFKIARQIAKLINHPESAGGCALVVDYGGDLSFGNSIRAFKEHNIVDVFETPGQCDMTANVDFAYLKEAMVGAATTYGPKPQRDFLMDMGFLMRLSKVMRMANKNGRGPEVRRAAMRLVDPTGMGKQYQVLGVTGRGAREEVVNAEKPWPFYDGELQNPSNQP